ncbi:zincin-like metallopeptidase domain-containing protein [Acidobacteria bacterium AH-259-O06]|nr:zincin-like metallopeptidase domain-containing protein [Acidobacteria bacterium AH-259-O06]
MPPAEVFTGDAEYYSTIFHELTHSTGHKSRLNRLDTDNLAPFGSRDYSQEELVAEMGAAFLCGHCRIENRTIDNSAAYIQGWLRRLRNDKGLVIFAAAQAQKAADFILGKGGNDETAS